MSTGPDERLTGLIERELRTACARTTDAGIDPDEVTVDLARRLRRVQLLFAGLTPDTAEDEP